MEKIFINEEGSTGQHWSRGEGNLGQSFCYLRGYELSGEQSVFTPLSVGGGDCFFLTHKFEEPVGTR